jgi:branched-chain amino acid transport system ATP-binding protein
MLEVRKLTAGYGNLRVLNEVSFSLTDGEILTVIGANGAGKSTLLWTLSGLIRPYSGKILFEDRDITGWKCTKVLGLGIAHIVQGMHVFSKLTVEDNLMLGGYGQRFKINMNILKDRHLSRVCNYFPVLSKKLKQKAGSLSGGEKQMLSIARALICEPKLMFLDEPSCGLAPLLVQHVFKLLTELRRDLALTFLLVEQNAEIALGFADRGFVLAQGQIMLEGEAQSLRNNKEVQEIYLGKSSINSVGY